MKPELSNERNVENYKKKRGKCWMLFKNVYMPSLYYISMLRLSKLDAF